MTSSGGSLRLTSIDSTGRHIGTTTTGASPVTVSYVRDVEDRIVSETTGSTTVRYGYTGAGDSPDYTLSTSNTASTLSGCRAG